MSKATIKPAPKTAPLSSESSNPAAPADAVMNAKSESTPGSASPQVQKLRERVGDFSIRDIDPGRAPAAGRPSEAVPCDRCGGETTNEGVHNSDNHPFAEYVYYACKKCKHVTKIVRRRRPIIR
jgi:hypothetical protein